MSRSSFRHRVLSLLLEVVETGGRPTGGALENSAGVPSLGGENVRQDGQLELSAVRRVPDEFFKAMPAGHLCVGDVLINKDGAQTGKVARYRGEYPLAAINEHLYLLRANSEMRQDFLFRVIQSYSVQSQIRGLITGSAQPGLNRTFLRRTLVPAPPLEEQWRIAEILDTIDETIQATERIIVKLALTRDGVLRHQLSGLLGGPMAPLIDLGAEVTVGIVVRPTQYYVTDGVPVLRSANVREDGLEMTNLAFISPADHALMSKTAVKPGDLVTVRTGYPGTTAVIPESVREANCVDIVITRAGSAIDPEFLSLWVNSDFGKGHVLARQGGLAQQHFNVGDMKGLPVPVLDRPEQQRLVKVRNSLMGRLRAEESRLSKLRRTRAGLAHDLVSGRVRTVGA